MLPVNEGQPNASAMICLNSARDKVAARGRGVEALRERMMDADTLPAMDFK